LATGSLGAPRTSVATAHLDASGAASYDFDLEWAIAGGAEPRPEPLVVHTGSIAAVLAPGAEAVRSLVTSLRGGDENSGATVTYDPNARPSLMGSPDDARAAIESMVALADVVKVSDEDLAWLASTDDVDAVARGWLDLGPAFVVVTRGGSGATAFLPGDRAVHVEAPKVEVADTVGAGDSFMGGLIDGLWSAGLLGGDRREALRAIGDETLSAILARCARIAAITVSRPGANPPGSAELDVAPEDTQP
jgi:fructokinase